ncbi:hypothetical protein BJ122_10591 [Rhodopseudomonas faecalis]|uniref:Excisionase family DNA binding protein n=1 Tax=Rhodopseudomonas faecalis TaxID=99655 RepID=A0A318TGP7_9BRAD|nr:hypothetical protein [Rhodopseudomonas faecalis]PYF03834.1 hypothetical protein BJ122_10591 [Rhodopseudomonas faecalis]
MNTTNTDQNTAPRKLKRLKAWREELGISAATAWRWNKSGRIKIVTVGGVSFVDVASFDATIEAAIEKAA